MSLVFLRIWLFTIAIVIIKIYYCDKNQTGNNREKNSQQNFLDSCKLWLWGVTVILSSSTEQLRNNFLAQTRGYWPGETEWMSEEDNPWTTAFKYAEVYKQRLNMSYY